VLVYSKIFGNNNQMVNSLPNSKLPKIGPCSCRVPCTYVCMDGGDAVWKTGWVFLNLKLFVWSEKIL